MTTPSTWSGYLSFSRDGTRLAFASQAYQSTLLRVPFDPVHEALTGPPEPVLKGTRPIRDHELSPNGEWVAFTEAGVPEDLFIARVDGTQYRRLTEDQFRDRGPAWAPGAKSIAFYSDRSGHYDVWTIRLDGSGLTALRKASGIPGFPVWSPDGSIVAFGYATWHLLDAKAGSATLSAPEPAFSPAERFIPTSWSTTGRIAGQLLSLDGSAATLAFYTLATKQFSRVPADPNVKSYWLHPVWLADRRRLIVRSPRASRSSMRRPARAVSSCRLPVPWSVAASACRTTTSGSRTRRRRPRATSGSRR